MKRPIAILARSTGARRWRPDSWVERADAWLWEHPIVQGVLGIILIGLFLFVLFWLAFTVPEVKP